jgi:hypothetical protein
VVGATDEIAVAQAKRAVQGKTQRAGRAVNTCRGRREQAAAARYAKGGAVAGRGCGVGTLRAAPGWFGWGKGKGGGQRRLGKLTRSRSPRDTAV